jgi:hypothetical protein
VRSCLEIGVLLSNETGNGVLINLGEVDVDE